MLFWKAAGTSFLQIGVQFGIILGLRTKTKNMQVPERDERTAPRAGLRNGEKSPGDPPREATN